jgi:hypothetical protein
MGLLAGLGSSRSIIKGRPGTPYSSSSSAKEVPSRALFSNADCILSSCSLFFGILSLMRGMVEHKLEKIGENLRLQRGIPQDFISGQDAYASHPESGGNRETCLIRYHKSTTTRSSIISTAKYYKINNKKSIKHKHPSLALNTQQANPLSNQSKNSLRKIEKKGH